MPTPAHVATGLETLRLTQPGYDLAEIYYTGMSKEVFSSRKLQTLLGNTGVRYRANFARTPVDALLERTEISGISSSDSGAKAFLDAVWEENELGIEAKDVHQRAFEFGDSYVIGMPDDTYATGVSLYVHDPRHVHVFYDPQSPRKKTHAIQRWHEQFPDGGIYLRVNIYYADRVEQWVSRDRLDDVLHGVASDAEQRADMVTYDDDIPLTFGVVPVFHFRTARPFGRPEHADAYGLQDMINKVIITMMAAIDYAGFPQRYVLTDEGMAAADAFSDPAPGSDPFATGQDFDASPGATWLLRATKSVGQFATADTQNFLRPLDSLIRQMSVVTDTPFHLFDLGGQTPSGESRRAAEAPLIKKVLDRQASFGVTWREVLSFCMQVGGVVSDAQINWAPAASLDDLDSWAAAKLQREIGIPLEQIALERGYAAEVVAAWQGEAAVEGPRAIGPAPDTSTDMVAGTTPIVVV